MRSALRRRGSFVVLTFALVVSRACHKSPTAPSSPVSTTGSLMVSLLGTQSVSGVNVAIAGPVQQQRIADALGYVMFPNLPFGV